MTTMSIRLPARRPLLRACLLALVMSMSFAPAVWSTPCDPTIFQPVPECAPQQQTAVRFSGWETQYWDYYCTSDHPYFWGLSSSVMLNFTWDNSCFSAIENVFGETAANKARGAISAVADRVETATSYLRENKFEAMAADLKEVIRKYPVQAIILGLGVFYLMSRGRSYRR